jgi:hypothetical protein
LKQTILIGIDDTDNKESRGTGYNARQLGHLLERKKLGEVHSISRHQHFVHPDIPFTSQNSSACLYLQNGNIDQLIPVCQQFMQQSCVPGSDGGLAIASLDNIAEKVIHWGKMSKKIVLKQADAWQLAKENDIFLEGFTGNNDGVIGALAAIGLRKWGNDGRCIWLKGKEIREISGIFSQESLKSICPIDLIITEEGIAAEADDLIQTGDWMRPAIKNHKITLYIEKSNHPKYKWHAKPKSRLKALTD